MGGKARRESKQEKTVQHAGGSALLSTLLLHLSSKQNNEQP